VIEMASKTDNGGLKSLVDELPFDRLKEELQHGLSSLGEKAISSAGERLTDLTDRLNDVADGGGFVGGAAKEGAKEAAEGGSPVKGALKGGLSGAKDKIKEKLGGGGSGGKSGTKSTNIVEEIDIGAPVSVVYNQWTQFQDWSGFMKKVDTIEQEDEAKANFKAQVFWSHRRWEAHILEQVPDEKIVWRSKGEKGHVDGAVTFHELAPNLTRVLVVLEYYPQGLFERTGNLWRAQGRRARLELKHFRRHVMVEVLQNPDEVEGWRGEIEDGKVKRSHDEVVEEEQQSDEYDGDDDEAPEDEYDDEQPEDEADEEYEEEEEEPEDEGEEPEDEADEELEDEYDEEEPEDEGEPEDEYEDEEPEDDEEYEDEEEPEDEGEPEDEYDDEELEDEEPRRRRKAS
jgi:Polyketide cyclase / dehydrase and lipid transport